MITFAAEERTDRTRQHPSAYPTNEPSKTETYKRQNNDETNDAQIHDCRNMACGCGGHSPRGKAGSPDKPGGLSIQLCKSEKKEFYIRYSS